MVARDEEPVPIVLSYLIRTYNDPLSLDRGIWAQNDPAGTLFFDQREERHRIHLAGLDGLETKIHDRPGIGSLRSQIPDGKLFFQPLEEVESLDSLEGAHRPHHGKKKIPFRRRELLLEDRELRIFVPDGPFSFSGLLVVDHYFLELGMKHFIKRKVLRHMPGLGIAQEFQIGFDRPPGDLIALCDKPVFLKPFIAQTKQIIPGIEHVPPLQ